MAETTEQTGSNVLAGIFAAAAEGPAATTVAAAAPMPPPGHVMPVARALLAEHVDEGRYLRRFWRGDWWKYEGPHWVEMEPAGVRKEVYDRLEHATYVVKGPKGPEVKAWNPGPKSVSAVIDGMEACILLDRNVDAPAWLSTGESATGYVPCRNGLIDVKTRERLPLTSDYFGTVGIPVDYDPDAGEPVEWMKFLRSLWPPDEDGVDAAEIRVLQQWFGYVLSGRLDLQKMLLLVGAPRCGKGTIARILRALVGHDNVTAPALAMMAQNFGLADAVGKTLMVVADARLGPGGQEAVVERLLTISGQDPVTIDRKNKPAWTGTLQTRIMMMSNELPRFLDASGAIASRYVILKTDVSFLGREDIELEGRLRREFPEILKWSLDGLDDLTKLGRFTETERHRDEMEALYDLVSPIKAFLRRTCNDEDAAASEPFADLYAAYEVWCSGNRRGAALSTARFSEQLKAAVPGLKTNYRPTVKGEKSAVAHVRGVRITDEWRKVMEAHARRKLGDDYEPPSEPPPGS